MFTVKLRGPDKRTAARQLRSSGYGLSSCLFKVNEIEDWGESYWIQDITQTTKLFKVTKSKVVVQLIVRVLLKSWLGHNDGHPKDAKIAVKFFMGDTR